MVYDDGLIACAEDSLTILWGKETRFGLAAVDLLRRRGGGRRSWSPSRGIRGVVGVDVAQDRRSRRTSRLRSRLWQQRRLAVGPSRACDRCDGWRRNGARVGGRMRG